MKKVLNNISWYVTDFLDWLSNIIVIILGTICWLIYNGVIFFDVVLGLYVVHKIFTWLGL